VTFDTVRKIARTLPGVEDATAYGSPAIKVNGTLMACIAVSKVAEPNSLMVRIDFDQREAMIKEAPDTYYLKDHYAPYPSVLVRLSQISEDELRDLLNASWRFVTTKMKRKKVGASVSSRGQRTLRKDP
jgi:hypothetical protein